MELSMSVEPKHAGGTPAEAADGPDGAIAVPGKHHHLLSFGVQLTRARGDLTGEIECRLDLGSEGERCLDCLNRNAVESVVRQ
jgi:hypothetical protein